MNPTVSLILGIIAAIALTVFMYIKVMPRKNDGNLPNKFWQFLHDFFHFKKLYLEEVLKGIYVLANAFCICFGVFLLITVESYHGYYYSRTTWYGGYGLLLIVFGPIVLRLTYEGIMMFILLVKNTIEINNKLKAPKAAAPAAPVETVPEAPVEDIPEAPAEKAAE